MKTVLTLLILLPTLISLLLFAIAFLSFQNPALLSAANCPTVAILCIIAGSVATIPLIAATLIGISEGISKRNKRKKERKHL